MIHDCVLTVFIDLILQPEKSIYYFEVTIYISIIIHFKKLQ